MPLRDRPIIGGIIRWVQKNKPLQTIRDMALGTPDPNDDPAPALIAVYRKAIGAAVGALLAWMLNTWGLDLTEAQAEIEALIYIVLSGFFSWLPRNNRPTPAT